MKPTCEQIEHATPEELNVWVAEMMGWRKFTYRERPELWILIPPEHLFETYNVGMIPVDGWIEPPPDATMYSDGMRYAPSFSTDIAAAIDGVVSYMAEQGYWCTMKTPFEPGGPFHAGFTPHRTTGWNGRADYRGSGDTLPLAICRAAPLWWIE